MPPKKNRVRLPSELAAQVLFASDRACCVCQAKGKPIQIHHIDDDPSNNGFANLAVLCLDCHDLTQIRGGFGRKLDADQVRLYRSHWLDLVAESRKSSNLPDGETEGGDIRLKLAVSLAEISIDKKDYAALANHYRRCGNTTLRDKYTEKAIEAGVSDETHISLRYEQGRVDLIPPEVAERERRRLSHGPVAAKNQLARHLRIMGDMRGALRAHAEGIIESLDEGRPFSAAYYLKEVIEEGFHKALFIEALGEFREEGDLWWEVRALEELGWRDEVKEVMQSRRREVERMQNPFLLKTLHAADGNLDAYVEVAEEMQRAQRTVTDEATGATYVVWKFGEDDVSEDG